MTSDEFASVSGQAPPSQPRPVQGLLAAAVASLLGAGAWALVTATTGHQLGVMAIAVGAVVGAALRHFGRGQSASFGVLGAALALLGCALGNLLALTALVADAEGMAFLDAVRHLTPLLAWERMRAFLAPMDGVLYAIASWEAYQLSFRTPGRTGISYPKD